jgi:hypothetical protein
VKRTIITYAFLLLLLFTANTVNADRFDCTWNELISSSEIIAKAYLEKIEYCVSDGKARKTTANFRISEVYKGERIQKVDVLVRCALEDTVNLNKLGEYFLFLQETKESYWGNFNLNEERFLRVEYLDVPSGNVVPVISEKSHAQVTDIPQELFTEKEIRIRAYGKTMDFRAKIMEASVLDLWLKKNASRIRSK